MLTLRLAWRSLARRPVSSLVVVLTAGFAVAVNSALFTVANGLLFRPLPYPNAGRIVHLEAPPYRFQSKPELVSQVMEASRTTPHLVGRCTSKNEYPFQPGSAALMDWGLKAAAVSPGCFDLFATKPVLGRRLAPGDERSKPRPLVLSELVWRTRFGGDAGVIDRVVDIPVTLDSQKWVIVGVMPASFGLASNSNCWYPYDDRDFLPSLVPEFAALALGTDIAALRAELPGVEVTGLEEFVRPGGVVAMTFVVLLTVIFLLVAFVQIGSLLLASAMDRVPDLAVHAAVGANRGQVLALFAAESALLSAGAFILSVVLLPALLVLVVSWLPSAVTTGRSLEADRSTFLVSAVLVAFGFALWSTLPASAARRS
ncbi:MAG: FtsX-like permease family protein, partial [Acidobacteria bacterium]